MKLSGNQQTLHQFVAAATLTSWGKHGIGSASARVGGGLREAPLRRGYDSTAPLETLEIFYNRPGSLSIEKTLKTVALENEIMQGKKAQNTTSTTTTMLRNINTENTTASGRATAKVTTKTSARATAVGSRNATDHRDLVNQLDLGVLNTFPSVVSSKDSAHELAPETSTCMIGIDKDGLLPADAYLRHEIETGRFAYSQILFDEASNTVFCNQENDADEDIGTTHHTYGCASMHFRGCATVKCNGKESCIDTTIEDAITIECEGYESCRDATLDASTVDCGGEAACMGATIGSKGYVTTLDCHSGESACAYSKTKSIGSVFCTGPLSCFGAEFLGVRHSVTCQGVPHPHKYYMPTCGGGDSGRIEAEVGQNIDVVCDGDFACIGNGPNEKDLPTYFGIDVGEHGTLTCGGSLLGNRDGFTFVCKYLDMAQECSSYECKDPSFALADHAVRGMIDTRNLRTCSKVFSLDQEEMCTGEDYDDGDNDDGDEGDDNDGDDGDDNDGDDDDDNDRDDGDDNDDEDESSVPINRKRGIISSSTS